MYTVFFFLLWLKIFLGSSVNQSKLNKLIHKSNLKRSQNKLWRHDKTFPVRMWSSYTKNKLKSIRFNLWDIKVPVIEETSLYVNLENERRGEEGK